MDIRKVDKGQLILVIDYSQRKKIEEKNILDIASLCENQASNWEENKDYVEEAMKTLYKLNFIPRDVLASVTGLLAGGKSGKLKNKNGSLKFTNILSSKELFAQQMTPYVYPLIKAHKVSRADLLRIKPENVHSLPSRLVVGMGSCQLTRVQIWLEHFLNPLSVQYGSFEYIKDTNDYLLSIEEMKAKAKAEKLNLNNVILFTIDVKALYPSVKFEHLRSAVSNAIDACTLWSEHIKSVIVDLVLYTLENQQIFWGGKFYLLNQGLATGAKHSVPLANILLTFILLESLKNNAHLNSIFESRVKLWKRFIDDGTGIFEGSISEFVEFFNMLQSSFRMFDLELTCDTDSHDIIDGCAQIKTSNFVSFLDVEIFKVNNTLHTREHRKETASSSFLNFSSAHPRHTFPGIIKSQFYRLRRLCSQEKDFQSAVNDLKQRCLNSGYPEKMISTVLRKRYCLDRILFSKLNPENNNGETDGSFTEIKVRLVILSGTAYQNELIDFGKRINSVLSPLCLLRVEIVWSTSLPLSRLLFNYNDFDCVEKCCSDSKCMVCTKALRSELSFVSSTVTGHRYAIDSNLNCDNGGIYIVQGSCNAQYTGKTVKFGKRFSEHFSVSKTSAVYCHKQECHKCYVVSDFNVTFVENYQKKGKYTLSEREFLWNQRIKGTMNVQKTLKAS